MTTLHILCDMRPLLTRIAVVYNAAACSDWSAKDLTVFTLDQQKDDHTELEVEAKKQQF